jgi:hypothetical protein
MDVASLKDKIAQLQDLLASLNKENHYFDKLAILNALPVVQEYIQQSGSIQDFLKILTPESEFAMKAIIAIGQAPVVFNTKNLGDEIFKKLVILLEQLLDIECFYSSLGGIVGYHLTVLQLIYNQLSSTAPTFNRTHYLQPEGLYIGKAMPEVRQAVRWGIENTKRIAIIYPLGGAGDRLNLKDEATGVPLPAALLPFLGRTLLEGMLRDLQAREYLYFKLFGEQLITPIAIMTSIEKNNHLHILNICKSCQWFGRPSEKFYFFTQPLVPVLTIEGDWSLSAPLTLTLKPCGHGVLWKLAEEQGIFNWLESQGRHQCLIRQINNPLAGTDNGLFALIGIGCHQQKAFGFLSCERLLNSDEGTNVLIENHSKEGYDYCLTNIEYPEFAQRGIGEVPAQPGSCFSIYPTNTNILFADLHSIREVLKVCPIPGKLINMKSKVSYIDPQGQLSYVQGGRLESTMQNIADHIVDHFPYQLHREEYRSALRTFIVYNQRCKTISTTKKSYKPGESPVATPEQAFYDLLSNHYSLFKQCQFELPEWRKIEEHLLQGPACILLFHPALGPLYSIIEQKIRKGRLLCGAELQLEIAEVDIEDLSLEGSLLIEAISPLGTCQTSGLLQYGQESRCTLQHVTIRNRGIDRTVEHQYWKNIIKRHEVVEIILHEGAEFHAEDISLEGSHRFEVPAHHRLVLLPESKGGWKEELLPIEKPTWYWRYTFDSQNAIQLKKVKTRRKCKGNTERF